MSSPIVIADWDSRFFGFPIGNLEIPADFARDELDAVLREAHTKFRLVAVTLTGNGPDNLSVAAAQCPCYARQLLYKKQTRTNVGIIDPHIRTYTSTFCTSALERLAVQSGTFSRFRLDPELSQHYEQLFLAWIHNAITKELADSVWTWVENGQHAGMVTIRCAKRANPDTGEIEREGRIGMLTVDSKYRRHGVGQSLLEACDYWCSSLDIPVNAIVVQKDNEAVSSLCQKVGFKLDGERSIYHYWSPGWIYDSHHGWVVK
jgi:GNAT superfamily N-acetyltransferase